MTLLSDTFDGSRDAHDRVFGQPFCVEAELVDGDVQILFDEFTGPFKLVSCKILGGFHSMRPLWRQDVEFIHCTFIGDVSFSAAQWKGDLTFKNCNFESKFMIEDSWVTGKTTFEHCNFVKGTNFFGDRQGASIGVVDFEGGLYIL